MKQNQPPVEVPAKEHRPKQFDTRMLDRLEAYCSEYRHWHSDDPTIASYPYGYIESQKEAYCMGLRNAAQAVADALRDGSDCQHASRHRTGHAAAKRDAR